MRISHDVFKFASDTIRRAAEDLLGDLEAGIIVLLQQTKRVRRRDDAYFELLRSARPMQRAVDSRPKSGRNAVWDEDVDDASDGMYNAIFASLLTHNPSLALLLMEIYLLQQLTLTHTGDTSHSGPNTPN